jgi:hypothetical protein
MSSLKKGGFGNSKIFSADDLKDLSPDEMSDKVTKIYTSIVNFIYIIINQNISLRLLHKLHFSPFATLKFHCYITEL